MLAASHYSTYARGLRGLLGATERLSRGLAGARGRKSILIFSDGFLNDVNQQAPSSIERSTPRKEPTRPSTS